MKSDLERGSHEDFRTVFLKIFHLFEKIDFKVYVVIYLVTILEICKNFEN